MKIDYEGMVRAIKLEPDEKLIDWAQAEITKMENKNLGKAAKRAAVSVLSYGGVTHRVYKVAPVMMTNKRIIIVGMSIGTGQLTDQKGFFNKMHNRQVKSEKSYFGTVSGNIPLNTVTKVSLKGEGGSILGIVAKAIVGIRYLNVEWNDKQNGPCIVHAGIGNKKKPQLALYKLPLISIPFTFVHPSRKWMKALRMQVATSSYYVSQQQGQTQEPQDGYQSHHPYQNQQAYPSQQQPPQQGYQSQHPYQNQQPYPSQQQQPPQQGYQSHHPYQNQQPYPAQQQQPPQDPKQRRPIQ